MFLIYEVWCDHQTRGSTSIQRALVGMSIVDILRYVFNYFGPLVGRLFRAASLTLYYNPIAFFNDGMALVVGLFVQ